MFDLNDKPNFFSGVITLEKSLFERLLSPFNIIVLFDLANTPIINLAKVPEFPASIIVLFFNEKPLRPTPFIWQRFFFLITFTPIFFTAINVL